MNIKVMARKSPSTRGFRIAIPYLHPTGPLLLANWTTTYSPTGEQKGGVPEPYSAAKKVTRNGTEKSVKKPWNTERGMNMRPEVEEMMGRVVSIVVAPPTLMGAKGPKRRTKRGAPSSVTISRMTLESKARVPHSAPRYSVRKILDRE